MAAVPSEATYNPLWPIIAFKEYIVPKWERPGSRKFAASEREKKGLLELYNYTPQTCDFPLYSSNDATPNMDKTELWCRLVKARLFDEAQVNDALLREFQEHEELDRLPVGNWEVRAFCAGNYDMLRTLLLWLDVERWVGEAKQCVQMCRQLNERSTEQILNEIATATVWMGLYRKIVTGLSYAYDLFGGPSPDIAGELGAPTLRMMRKDLQHLPGATIRRVCMRHEHSDAPLPNDQLRILLSQLFANRYLSPKRDDYVRFLPRITPDNSGVLVELANELNEVVQRWVGRRLVPYLLEHQRPVLNAVWGTPDEPQNIGTWLVEDALRISYFNVRLGVDVEMLNLFKRHNLRLNPELPDKRYDRIMEHCCDEFSRVVHCSGTAMDMIYWLAQVGYPMARQFSREPGDMPYTLLEQCIVGLGRAELIRCWSGTRGAEAAKCAALRCLIAGSDSPVPSPRVMGELLEKNALTTLFIVVYYLYRAGRRVVFPEMPDAPSDAAAYHIEPIRFPQTALITCQMIRRLGESGASCPASYLRRLELLGGGHAPVEEKKVMTLQGLTLKAVHRHLHTDPHYPHLRPDNFKRLRRQPIHGEVILPYCSQLLPEPLIRMLSLDDLMEEFLEEIRSSSEQDPTWFPEIHRLVNCF